MCTLRAWAQLAATEQETGADTVRWAPAARVASNMGVSESDLASRCVKDETGRRLPERRRDLFADLSLVFMDITTLSFHDAGGERLGAR